MTTSAAALALAASTVLSQPWVVTPPYYGSPQPVTCVLQLDKEVIKDKPIIDETGLYCKVQLPSMAGGMHKAIMRYVFTQNVKGEWSDPLYFFVDSVGDVSVYSWTKAITCNQDECHVSR